MKTQRQRSRKPRVALVYDFDGTLAPGNMQEQSFLPAVNINKKKFWNDNLARTKEHDMDEILSYMELMLEHSRATKTPVRRDTFKEYGQRIKFFPGVDTWFSRVGTFAKQAGVVVAHYIISSGNQETIEGTSIARHFAHIYASRFRYDENGVAVWPALAINYTNKAQFLFRINKGIENAYDNSTINQYTPEEQRPVPFRNFIYLGDGLTDVPAMKMVTYQGGKSIVVYKARTGGAKTRAHNLVEQHRADIAVPADYRSGRLLDKAVKAAIQQIAARHTFEQCDTSPLKGLRPPK
ncbi:MAG: haloacid dehalogenase-like hydrolase [Planctomycetes bacterium]|nr:haloacid dehalogenase-like hydrolase [Planctomycetota bacterium]NOG55550.1 haloacid dehalogenase-like hydrolase [Planctomycetota bacterium]